MRSPSSSPPSSSPSSSSPANSTVVTDPVVTSADPAMPHAISGTRPETYARKAIPARVTVLASASAAIGALPIPIAPRRALIAIRAAIAHDTVARFGLALLAESRTVLSQSAPLSSGSTLLRGALEFVATRALLRLSPYAIALGPVRAGYETFAFARLLDRYLSHHRGHSPYGLTLRIELAEAQWIRRLIDRASLAVVMPSLEAEAPADFLAPEDYRGTMERMIDGFLLGTAKIPERIALRLDAALDKEIASHPQHVSAAGVP